MNDTMTNTLRLMRDTRWRSVQDIADETGESVRDIGPALKALREKPYCHKVERRRSQDGVTYIWRLFENTKPMAVQTVRIERRA